jgi:hypothetical protein
MAKLSRHKNPRLGRYGQYVQIQSEKPGDPVKVLNTF